MAQGEVEETIKNENSITGDYLSGKFIAIPKRRSAKNGRFIEINGASGNNLKKLILKYLLVHLLVLLEFQEVGSQL